jgi:asparagine synthase (glutamine-hydrolysing)
VYLSGGLDSSVVAALVRHADRGPLRTFSVTFDDPEFDEQSYQQDVIRFLDTEHSEVRCTPADIARAFPEVVRHTEKPVLRTAPAPLYLLSRLARDSGYKVVLTGEGADEVLGGYDIYKEAKIRRFWGVDPASSRRPLLLRRLYPYLASFNGQPDAYLRAFFGAGLDDLDNPLFSHLPRWASTSGLKRFLSKEVRAEIGPSDGHAALLRTIPPGYRQWDPFCQAQYLETTQLLPGYILSSQGDRVAMAHAVEGRFPFLDYRLVEFAARIPPRLKMRGLDEKYILKRTAAALVPASVRTRKKQPYRAPEARSFFPADPATAPCDYAEELLSAGRVAEFGVFSATAVDKLVAKVRTGRASGARDNMALTGILSTQLVLEQFVKNSRM